MGKKKPTAKKAVRISDADEKKKALEVALAHLEKDFGTGTIMRLGDNAIQDIETVPTGSIGLDIALGVGGVPRGRITEIFGAESSGKTTLAIHIIAEAQKQGGVCAIIDAEHAFDRFYAEQLGVDVNNLWISQPDNGEQALEIAEQLINSGAVDVLVIDSVAALTPKAEIEGEMGDKNVGLQARLMSQAMRKLTGAISRTRTCCIFINQTREKIGNMYGPAQTTTGGNALKFYSTVRIEITPSSMIKDSDDKPIGRLAKVKVVKNKVAPPFKKAEFDIMFGQGISKSGEIIDYGVELDIIKKSGAWFSYGDSKIGQGKEGVRKILNDNPELMAELEEKVRKAILDSIAENRVPASFAGTKTGKKEESYDSSDDFDSMAAENGDEDFFEEDFEIEE
ncbi:MAG: recombinase RecA [Muribaculaceae bacterium]|nr:recombinase RecA [Muribaculaceae bacterium]